MSETKEKKKDTKPIWFVRTDGPSRNEYNPASGEVYKSELHIPFLVQPNDLEYFRKRLQPKKCFVELGLKLPEEYTRVAKSGKKVATEPEEVKEEKAEAEDAAMAKEKEAALGKTSTGAAANQIQTPAPAETPKPAETTAEGAK